MNFIKDIECYNFDKELDKDVKIKFEDYLTKRMKEETKNSKFKFNRKIDLNKTDGLISLYEEDGKDVYWFSADCDHYVFEAELWLKDNIITEDEFGTSLSD